MEVVSVWLSLDVAVTLLGLRRLGLTLSVWVMPYTST
jgi:hypothetical protein